MYSKKMRPPFHRNFTHDPDAARQERPQLRETRQTFGTDNRFPQEVFVRSQLESALMPKDHGSLPLKEVNDAKFQKNIVGVGKRFDRTSVRTPLYGPLSAFARVDDERVEGDRTPNPMVTSF